MLVLPFERVPPGFWRWWAGAWVVFCLVFMAWDVRWAIQGSGALRWFMFFVVVMQAVAGVLIVKTSAYAAEARRRYHESQARLDASIDRLKRLERGEEPG